MRSDRDEDGFTLIELLMAIVMTAVIAGAVAAALSTALRNTDSTADRLGDTVDTQLLSTYLPGDIQNAGPNVGDISTAPAATAGCTGLTGANALALRWTDAESGAAYGITYRTLTVGTEQRLQRFTCGGTTPGASVVARGLAVTNGAMADLTGDPRIVFTLTSAKGYVSKLYVMRRTYAGGTVAPPPLACFVDAATLNPPTGRNADGTLVPAPLLTVQASGNCGTLRATYTPDPSAAARVDVLGTGPGTTTTTLRSTGWTSGDRPITLSSNGLFLADVPFTVVDAPCVVTNVRTSPVTGARAASPSPNVLTSAVTVTADFADTCTLTYNLAVSTDGGAEKTYLFPTTGLTRSVVLPVTTRWSDGDHSLRVIKGTTTTQLALGGFRVEAQACAVGTPVLSPTSVNANKSGVINKAVTMSVSTSGVCDALSVKYAPAGTSVLQSLTADGTGTNWSYTIGTGDHVWTAGQKTFEVVSTTGASFSPSRTVDLEVR